SSQHHIHPYLPPFPTRRSSDLSSFSKYSRDGWKRTYLSGPLTWPSWRLKNQRRTGNASSTVRGMDCCHVSWMTFLLKVSLRAMRSEEHTSELQSREKLVCRLLL